MTTGRGQRELPLRAGLSWERWRFVWPAWFIRKRIRRLDAEIDRLERLLAGEFGLLETAALVEEHSLLVAYRDAVTKDLGR